MTNIIVDDANTNYSSVDGILYNKDASVLICCPGAKESVTIPENVTSIGNVAFSECSSLTSVNLPNSLISIGDFAFLACKSLESITIPESVTYVGARAFFNCDNLISVYCKAVNPPVTAYNYDLIISNYDVCKLYVPTGCKDIYRAAYGWSCFMNIEEMDFSGINEIPGIGNEPRITIENGTLKIVGIYRLEPISVYDMQGRVIYCGTGDTISNLGHGCYIVKIGDKTDRKSVV